MSRSYEAPVETEEHTSHGVETKTTHPAFAQIGASRVQGTTNLYGTELNHQHFLTVTIRRSVQHRSLSGEHAYAGEELICVAGRSMGGSGSITRTTLPTTSREFSSMSGRWGRVSTGGTKP